MYKVIIEGFKGIKEALAFVQGLEKESDPEHTFEKDMEQFENVYVKIIYSKDKAIFKEDGQWFFWDETWSESHGPYETDKEAANALTDYCENLDIR